MRVLVVDQDSASNLAITRSLRDLYTVDCVTNKGDCLDLLRSNSFEVIVATERLEDGSGLELLGQISKKWPSVLRIFAADRQRLQLLRGRLGPFELFQTLAYPIDAGKLLASLEKAAALQGSHSQEVALPGEVADASNETPDSAESPTEPPIELSALDAPLDLERSDEFSEPRFARAGRAEPIQASASRRPVSVGPRAPRARRVQTPQSENDLAAKFPGSGTFGPRRTGGEASGRTPRSGRERGAASKAMPVRFPPLERKAAPARVPPLESPQPRNTGEDFSEAAALAQAARSNYERAPEELDAKRLTTLIGGGVAVAAVVLFLGFKIFGSNGEAPKPAAPSAAIHVPEYPPEVTQLVAQTEAAFKADDFKAARADVDRLRQLSPSHPRLEFFQGLLSRGKGAVAGHGAGVSSSSTLKRNGSKGGAAPVAAKADPTWVAKDDTGASVSSGSTSAGVPAVPSFTTTRSSSETTETPVAVTREATESAAAEIPPTATPATPTAAEIAPTPATPATAAPSAAQASHTTTGATTTSPSVSRRGTGEPPPVVQEAKLIRRVNPDYPSAARRDGTTGSVDLEVTVSPAGVVENVSVLQATPPDVFDKAAVAAVRKWKYDPRFVDGLPSQAHLKVRLEFGPNK